MSHGSRGLMVSSKTKHYNSCKSVLVLVGEFLVVVGADHHGHMPAVQ